MKKNIIKHPQMESIHVISLRVDLQNTLFYDYFGNNIGWYNQFHEHVEWDDSKKFLLEELYDNSTIIPSSIQPTYTNGNQLMAHYNANFQYPRDFYREIERSYDWWESLRPSERDQLSQKYLDRKNIAVSTKERIAMYLEENKVSNLQEEHSN